MKLNKYKEGRKDLDTYCSNFPIWGDSFEWIPFGVFHSCLPNRTQFCCFFFGNLMREFLLACTMKRRTINDTKSLYTNIHVTIAHVRKNLEKKESMSVIISWIQSRKWISKVFSRSLKRGIEHRRRYFYLNGLHTVNKRIQQTSKKGNITSINKWW